jgi:hypothetical protein
VGSATSPVASVSRICSVWVFPVASLSTNCTVAPTSGAPEGSATAQTRACCSVSVNAAAKVGAVDRARWAPAGSGTPGKAAAQPWAGSGATSMRSWLWPFGSAIRAAPMDSVLSGSRHMRSGPAATSAPSAAPCSTCDGVVSQSAAGTCSASTRLTPHVAPEARRAWMNVHPPSGWVSPSKVGR